MQRAQRGVAVGVRPHGEQSLTRLLEARQFLLRERLRRRVLFDGLFPVAIFFLFPVFAGQALFVTHEIEHDWMVEIELYGNMIDEILEGTIV